MIVLGIEGTAHTVGVGITDGKNILANVFHMYHPPQGGIHPREAANHHAEYLPILIRNALKKANVKIEDIDGIAFSQGPGLGPCLRTVATGARLLSLKLNIPIVGVNHCIAHLEIGRFATGAEDPVMLYVSGGNTQIISYSSGRYRVFGETMDIGIGNMLDKLGIDMSLPFPGGPKIEVLAKKKKKYLEMPYSVHGMDVSFSGLLTSAKNYLNRERKEDVAYSVQETAFSMLTEITERALTHLRKDEVLLAGGVARNKRLRDMLDIMCHERGAKLYVPPPELCVDNGAMIAHLGYLFLKHGVSMKVEDTGIIQRFRTDDVDIPWELGHHRKEYKEAPGAEAIIKEGKFFGRRAIEKIRIPKGYRIPEIDRKLRKERTRKEARIMHSVKEIGVKSPVIYDIDESKIFMEKIDGNLMKDFLSEVEEKEVKKILRKIARIAAMMHRNGFTHGDFTTSNMILKGDEIYLIDFSMGEKNGDEESMAVDLHMFEESFKSAHFKFYHLMDEFYDEYENLMRKEVIEKVMEIKRRRRYV